MLNYALVALGVVLNVAAQVALKAASGGRQLSLADPQALFLALVGPLGLLAMALYATSVVNWIVVLSRLDFSIAYPLMATSYILTFVLGMKVYHEPFSWVRLAGVLVIVCGVILITRPVPLTPGATP